MEPPNNYWNEKYDNLGILLINLSKELIKEMYENTNYLPTYKKISNALELSGNIDEVQINTVNIPEGFIDYLNDQIYSFNKSVKRNLSRLLVPRYMHSHYKMTDGIVDKNTIIVFLNYSGSRELKCCGVE